MESTSRISPPLKRPVLDVLFRQLFETPGSDADRGMTRIDEGEFTARDCADQFLKALLPVPVHLVADKANRFGVIARGQKDGAQTGLHLQHL